MNLRSVFTRVAGPLALVALSAVSWAQSFGQADLEKVVKELEVYSAKFPDYVYPIKSSVVEKDDVNAYATVEKDKNGKLQGVMVVYTGFVKFVNGDLRLIRACVAHEISHLAKGHCTMPGWKPSDLNNLWTRQQEFEADVTGASLLQKAGYSKNDMAELMLKLDELDQGSWLGKLTGDHASGKARAAQIVDNPMVLKSLMDFEVGMAFMETRKYRLAMDAFDRAVKKEPGLKEAYTNSAQAAIMYYYDNLPLSVQQSWFRPDFGPLLAPPVPPRSLELTDDDRKRWQDARTRVSAALDKNKDDLHALELAALVLVLDPDGKADNLKAGTDLLLDVASKSLVPAERLRTANNAALGLQRMGKLADGVNLMLSTQKGTDLFNPYLAENLGVNEVPKGDKDQAALAAAVLGTWLDNTAPAHPNYEKVKKNYIAVCNANNFKVMDFKGQPIYLCKVMSINDGGQEFGMFEPFEKYNTTLGKPDGALQYDERYPDLMEVRWRDGNLTILTERDEILRVTSYSKDAYILLRAQDSTLNLDFKIAVGMSKADFTKILDPEKATKVNLIKGGTMEEWLYWPGLNMGVLFKDDKIVGVTATGAK